ncbi:MAG: DUF357 domain-containing protein [Candidatus Pacearchaeota archaeon]|jgi:hypothetical protein
MKKEVADRIKTEKIEKYFALTEKALRVVRKKIFSGKEEDAGEIIKMVEAYLSDAHFFEKNGDYVNCFAAINYAHGWIDCGVRLGIFDVDDDKLFTIK